MGSESSGGGGGGAKPISMGLGDASQTGINPHGIIDVISYIEQCYANCSGYHLSNGDWVESSFYAPASRFSTKQRWEFMEVGFKAALISGLALAMLTPVAMAVFERVIPVFGDAKPSLFDQAYVLMLSLGFSFSYSAFIAQVCMKWKDGLSNQAVKSLMQGFVIGGVMKAMIVFVLFHFIYLKLLTDGPLLNSAIKLQEWGMSQDKVLDLLQWTMGARHILTSSAWLVVGSTMMSILIPTVAYYIKHKENKRRDAATK